MSKKIKAVYKLYLNAGKATSGAPVGTTLGQHGVNLATFCKEYNDRTRDLIGEIIPAKVNVYDDRSYAFSLKTQPMPLLIKKYAGIENGSGNPQKETVGVLDCHGLENIYDIKKKNLNTRNCEIAKKIITATAGSMCVMTKNILPFIDTTKGTAKSISDFIIKLSKGQLPRFGLKSGWSPIEWLLYASNCVKVSRQLLFDTYFMAKAGSSLLTKAEMADRIIRAEKSYSIALIAMLGSENVSPKQIISQLADYKLDIAYKIFRDESAAKAARAVNTFFSYKLLIGILKWLNVSSTISNANTAKTIAAVYLFGVVFLTSTQDIATLIKRNQEIDEIVKKTIRDLDRK